MSKAKILIVDNDKDIRKTVKKRFEFSGFDCVLAGDGEEAIKVAKEEQPSVIILDLVMPKMDGFEAYKALKFDRATKNIPIIAYTADPKMALEKIRERDRIDERGRCADEAV